MNLYSNTLTIFFCLLINITFAQTNISGSITSNTTWDLAGSPYLISGNLVVFNGVILTIDPGVEIRFETNAGIELRGTLTAIGTVNDSIEFTSNATSPAKGDWKGITAIGTDPGDNNQLTMEYIKASYANVFINLDLAYRGPYRFKSCAFYENNKVNLDGGSPETTFDDCLFKKNKFALNWTQFKSRVSHSEFIGNSHGAEGIGIVDSCYFFGNTSLALEPREVTNGCTIVNNNIAVRGRFNSMNRTFTNNVVTGNTKGVQIQSYFNGVNTFTGNTICGNKDYNIFLNTSDNADLSDNCWCLKDSASIRSTFIDGYVNTSYGLASFATFDTTCEEVMVSNEAVLTEKVKVITFPNPFHELLTFQIDSPQTHKLIIRDLTGRMILERELNGEISLNTTDLIPGMFMYTLSNGNQIVRSGKVLKQ